MPFGTCDIPDVLQLLNPASLRWFGRFGYVRKKHLFLLFNGA